jgi:cysteine desulfurase/selenocysteine lyase
MRAFGLEAAARASFAIYNTVEEVDLFAEELKRVVSILRG